MNVKKRTNLEITKQKRQGMNEISTIFFEKQGQLQHNICFNAVDLMILMLAERFQKLSTVEWINRTTLSEFEERKIP